MLRRYVLIFHAGGLGDFLLTWPIAMALARLRAQQRIVYVTHGAKGQLAERVIGAEWDDAERWGGAFGGELSEELAKRVDMTAEAFTFGAAGALEKTLADRGVAVTTLPNRPAGKHMTETYADALDEPILADGVRQSIARIRNHGLQTTRPKQGPILLHTGSGGTDKCWPVERWAELAGMLKNAELICGEAEADRGVVPDNATVLPTLDVLHEKLRTATAYVGHDTGPTHLAAALGLPTLALFGPTNPAHWSPLGPSVKVVTEMKTKNAADIAA
ncbi:MAG: glycosyltransferase family 9 protein, partial [Planctomycetota bacterium]